MLMLFIFAILSVWIVIYIIVLKIAYKIIEATRKSDLKRFNVELDDYDLEKKMIFLKVTAFFILLPIGFICMYFIL